jgi:hypothetical protein
MCNSLYKKCPNLTGVQLESKTIQKIDKSTSLHFHTGFLLKNVS